MNQQQQQQQQPHPHSQGDIRSNLVRKKSPDVFLFLLIRSV